MNFDLLATILFILFFVVGPLLQRSRRGQQRPPPGRGNRPSGRQAGSPPAPPRSDDTQGPLAERLEEARRRVLEAMGEEPGREARPQPGQKAPRAREQKLDWQEVVKPEESFMATGKPKRSTLRSETGAVISAPPLRTERRRASRRPAKLAVGRGFGMGGDAIMNGIIWHEILSEPVSRRGTRRQTSRLRSR